jgi:hypothetical protein
VVDGGGWLAAVLLRLILRHLACWKSSGDVGVRVGLQRAAAAEARLAEQMAESEVR